MEENLNIEGAIDAVESRLQHHRDQVVNLSALRDKLAQLKEELGNITGFLNGKPRKAAAKRKLSRAPRGSVIALAKDLAQKDEVITAKAVEVLAAKRKIPINPRSIYATLLTSPRFTRVGRGTFQLRSE